MLKIFNKEGTIYMGTKLRTYVDVMALHNEVTGSCNFLVVKMPTKETFKIIVDCGLFQERENSQFNKEFPFNVDELDYVLVTHNHVDHIGRLPLLLKKQYSGYIYCTPMTKTLIPFALEDSYKVLRDVSKRNNEEKLYSDDDVRETLKRLKAVEYGKTIELNRYIKATFFKNGHLLGASLILIQIQFEDEEAINLLFTGDYNNKNSFFDVPEIPKWVRKLPLTIIQESTYGNMESSEMIPCFRKNVSDKLKKGGTVIIPAFSLGRSQEVLKTLRDMQDKGEIDPNIPVYLDGKLAINYTLLYLKGGYEFGDEIYLKDSQEKDDKPLDFLPYDTTFVESSIREDVVESKESKIIVTTSGSASYGPAPYYLQHYLGDKNAMVHFTGYLFEESLGRRIKETPDGEFVKVGGMILKKLARIEYTAEYSAHAKADEMIEFLRKFSNLNAVLVNHGEFSTKEIFAKRIAKETSAKNVAILNREYFFRISPWGIVKSLSTEFM